MFVKHQLRINFDLRTEQMMALSTQSTVASREKDCLCVLPTGCGKSLIYQLLPFVFDELQSEGKCSSCVIVVSSLSAIMEDQICKDLYNIETALSIRRIDWNHKCQD